MGKKTFNNKKTPDKPVGGQPLKQKIIKTKTAQIYNPFI